MVNDSPPYDDSSISASNNSYPPIFVNLAETPKTFSDILPPSLITTSSGSEARYYKKSKFTKAVRRFTIASAAPSTSAEDAIPGPPPSNDHTRALSLDAKSSQRTGVGRHPEDDFSSPWAPASATTTMERMSIHDKGSSYSVVADGPEKSMPRSSSRMKQMMSSLRRSITSAGTSQRKSGTNRNQSFETKKLSRPKEAGKHSSAFGTMAKFSGKGEDEGYFELSD